MSTKEASNGERCKICSNHRWAIDNTYLAEGSSAARALCDELGISQASFYRHIRGHLPLSVSTPPSEPKALEWSRAVVNLASAVEAYRIVKIPGDVGNINLGVGVDDGGTFIELIIIYSGDALDRKAVESMGFDLELEISFDEIVSGIRPTNKMSAKLHAPEIFLGRRKSR